ncbi:Transposase-associated domain [Dillenia turbinata]|uniref:Transposase-associated domain n=1 Tax=Dillenia turbinata TaxID=194707 RepID=A0AAN8UKF1_9MAGN
MKHALVKLYIIGILYAKISFRVMDKSRMEIKNRRDEAYYLGVKKFLEFAYIIKEGDVKILCPCSKCNNYHDQYKDIVMTHLIKNGIGKDYTRWIYHGEAFEDDLDEDNVAYNVEHKENDDNDLDMMLNDIGAANWEYENLSKCPNEKCNEPRYKSNSSKVPRKINYIFLNLYMAGPGKGGQSLKKSKIDSYILRNSLSSPGIKATTQERSNQESKETVTSDSFRSQHFRRFNFVDKDASLVNIEKSSNPGMLKLRHIYLVVKRHLYLILQCSNSYTFNIGQSSSALVAKKGPTRNITLCRKRSANETMSVVLDVKAKRIVGVDSQFFISEFGCVVRKFGRHNVSKWSKMDENDRENIYNVAMARFGVDDSTMTKAAMNKQLNAQYRTHRYKLHKYFQTFQSKEEALRHPPADVPEEDSN